MLIPSWNAQSSSSSQRNSFDLIFSRWTCLLFFRSLNNVCHLNMFISNPCLSDVLLSFHIGPTTNFTLHFHAFPQDLTSINHSFCSILLVYKHAQSCHWNNSAVFFERVVCMYRSWFHFFFLCKGYQELLDQISNSGTNFQSFNFLVSLHRWPSLSSQICLGCYSYQLFLLPLLLSESQLDLFPLSFPFSKC